VPPPGGRTPRSSRALEAGPPPAGREGPRGSLRAHSSTHSTRLSCHRFRANEVRLLLRVIAYNLGNLQRRLILPLAIQSWSLTSLQHQLFKTGGRRIGHARYFM
jgi:hypothetical protein